MTRQIRNFKTALEDGTERMLRSLFVYVPAILESVDSEGLGVVVKKDDKNVTQDKVPIFSLYSGDGYGEEHALHPPEEGMMLCPKYPLEDVMSQPGTLEEVSHSRHYSFVDGHFIAGPRFHNFEAPLNSPMEAYHYKHKSGAERYISPEGDMRFTHPDGHEVELTNSEVSVTFSRSDGENMSITVSETDVVFDGPDLYNDFATDPRVRMGVSDDGSGSIDGRIAVGDSDAYRVDKTTLNTDQDDPKTYEEVNEQVQPIQDTTNDSETQYDNPTSVSYEGPVDQGFYEARNAVVERREIDPDPAVTDETDPAFIDIPDDMRSAGLLPVGYQYIETTVGELRMIGMDGTTPISIKPL